MKLKKGKKYSKEFDEFIISELVLGKSVREIYKEKRIQEEYEGKNFKSFHKYVERLKKEHGLISNQPKIQKVDQKIIDFLKGDKIVKIEDLLIKIKCTKKILNKSIINCKRNGYHIDIDNGMISLNSSNHRPKPFKPLGCTEIIFGVVSDPHFGSKSCQLTALNEFSDIMKKHQVKHIFCPGDLVAGFSVYPGQIYDVYAIDSREQEETTLINLPLGFDWYVLGGNHDYSFIKNGGGNNIISSIANKRSDVHYLGFDEATVPILNNVDVMLVHPSGGVPYSISYRLQKNIEQITISELQNVVRGVKDKPTVRFVLLGHLHIQMQAMFGSIWGAQCGTFEGQTNYLKRKGLIPTIGGWIVKATLGKNGLLKNFESKFYIFDEIEDDWKNYNHTLPEQKIIKPIFE